jgi:hypothetical protein
LEFERLNKHLVEFYRNHLSFKVDVGGWRMAGIFNQKSNGKTRSPIGVKTQIAELNGVQRYPRSLRQFKLILGDNNALSGQGSQPSGNGSVSDYNAEAEDRENKIRHCEGIVVTIAGFILGVFGLWQGFLRKRLVVGSASLVVGLFFCFVGPWRFFGLI